VAKEVLGHDRVELHVRSQIPVARGLGSSAALAVAAAAAAGAKDPLAYGFAVDGHPENAAASVMGGLVAAAVAEGVPVARHLRLDPDIRFVVVVPDRHLTTSRARGTLPELVTHKEAAFNLSRLGLLVAGLADHTQLVATAGDDRLHQDRRAALFPEAPALLAGLRQAGALTSCWSGAGPSILGICSGEDAEAVAASARLLALSLGVPGQVLVLEADRAGTVVQEIC
jgi:homoserine kinase